MRNPSMLEPANQTERIKTSDNSFSLKDLLKSGGDKQIFILKFP